MSTKPEFDFDTLLSDSAARNNENSGKAATKPAQNSSTDGFISSIGFQPPTPLSSANPTSSATPTRPQFSPLSTPLFGASLNTTSESNPLRSGFSASSTTTYESSDNDSCSRSLFSFTPNPATTPGSLFGSTFRSDFGASSTTTHTSINNGSSSRPTFSFTANPAAATGSLFGSTSVHSPTTSNANSRPLFGYASSSNNPSFGSGSYVPSIATLTPNKPVQISTHVPAFNFLPTDANDPATTSVTPTLESIEFSFNNLNISTEQGTDRPHAPHTSHIKTTSPTLAPSNPPIPITTTSSDNSILTHNHYDLNSARAPPSPSHSHDFTLDLESEDPRTHYQTIQFHRKWTSHLISHLTGIPIIRATTPLSHRPDHPNELKTLTHHLNRLPVNELTTAESELEALITHLLSRPVLYTPQSSLPKPDTLLYRVHAATSKSPFDRTTGIRCSGWIDSLYISDTADSRQADGRAFQSHCNRDKVPSPYISVSTSVARLMRLSDWPREEEAESRVFVISLNRLRRLGIKAQSTNLYFDEFLDSAGERTYRPNGWNNYENGVSYVTDSHWLVEEWIPDQAIVSEMDCEEFLKIAERGGINWEIARKNPFNSELEPLKIDLEKWPKRDVRAE
ncbi:uncharacterized protein EAF01_004602 [Botrytis porri]|uniref:uncharacterized protein n=1 Tax=Botrytis porri TaxID=87229 RepID=UPI00190054CA|nr:uncharacterized protein EAF01_004602 [Botrytis porri]KAF7907015.1 hypothetical protein EAF01_004602 [Botrytis porri]